MENRKIQTSPNFFGASSLYSPDGGREMSSSLTAKGTGAPVTFGRLSRASFMSHLLAPPSCRAGISPWLALWYGMVSHWLSGHFLEYSPRHSFSNLKQHYSAELGLAALLSSPT